MTDKQIIKILLIRACARGYLVSVHDSEEWVLKRKGVELPEDAKEVLGTILDLEECTVRIRDTSGKRIGDLFVVFNNDGEPINDCTDTPEMLELIG
jgi:hypothetical protein